MSMFLESAKKKLLDTLTAPTSLMAPVERILHLENTINDLADTCAEDGDLPRDTEGHIDVLNKLVDGYHIKPRTKSEYPTYTWSIILFPEDNTCWLIYKDSQGYAYVTPPSPYAGAQATPLIYRISTYELADSIENILETIGYWPIRDGVLFTPLKSDIHTFFTPNER